MRWFYTALLYSALPLVLLFLLLRSGRNPGFRRRWGERFGRFAAPPRTGGIVVHAASLGEVNAASALIGAITKPRAVSSVAQSARRSRVTGYGWAMATAKPSVSAMRSIWARRASMATRLA